MNTLPNIKEYIVQEEIGSGGFGQVFRAERPVIGGDVAIKVIHTQHANRPDFIRRFENEAQLIARLDHLHIVPLHDYWRDPDGAYLVMRWLRGGNLKETIAQAPLSMPDIVRIMNQICAALEHAHRNGVIHRDLKPANILFDEDGNAYLADFGIAKDLSKFNQHTQTGEFVGTVGYTAPEQIRGEEVTPRTDVYSLGVILYEMLTGEHPFPNLNTVEQIYKSLNDPIPLISSLDPAMQDDINIIVQKATAKDPTERYAGTLELASAFREVVSGFDDPQPETLVELLTHREQDILKLMIEGKKNQEIANILFVSMNTVKWYITQIYKKLKVRNRVQAIVKARELNLIVTDVDEASNGTGSLATYLAMIELSNPYKGLKSFQVADEADYFGRDQLIQKLLRRLQEDEQYQRFLTIIGPSGSGKSSLVKAGLIPAVLRGEIPNSADWYIVDMLPGSQPIDELEVALMKIAADQSAHIGEQLNRDERGLVRISNLILPDDGKTELLIIIDQFEEVFTLVEDEAVRSQFLNLLYYAVTEKRSRVRVVVTLRADFYDRPLQYPEFGNLVRQRMETILPLNAKELEQAITQPAARVGVTFEAGLVSSIISEINYQAGALPLLQYALTELFEHREGRVIPLVAYQEIGRTTGALAKRADEIYNEFSPEGQALTRQIFMRLVTLGEGTEDTRRRVERHELTSLTQNIDLLEEIIDTFANYRLLSLDHDPATRVPTVEVAHEAILREWELLRTWLNDNREDIKTQRMIGNLAQAWTDNNGDSSYLLRGNRLEKFERWFEQTELSLTPVEQEFIQKSLAERQWEADVDAERQTQKEHLEKRARRVLQGLVAVFLFAATISGLLALFAFDQSNTAQAERDNAQDARATSDTSASIAQRQRDEAQGLYLAAEANRALERHDTDLALALILEAYRLNPDSIIVRRTLVEVVSVGGTKQIFEGHNKAIFGLAISPDNRLVASCSSDGTTRLWDIQTSEVIYDIPLWDQSSTSGECHSASFSPDNKYFAVGGGLGYERAVAVFNVQTGENVRNFTEATHTSYAVTFSPDSQYILSGGFWGEVILWDINTGTQVHFYPRQDYIDTVRGLSFSPDGRTFVASSNKASVLIDVETGQVVRVFDYPQYSEAHSFTRTWPSILATGRDAVIWNIETSEEIHRIQDNIGGSGDISPDGQFLIHPLTDDSIGIWNIKNGNMVSHFYGHKSLAYKAIFSPDGHTALSTGGSLSTNGDNTIRLWNVNLSNDIQVFDGIGHLSPDGTMLLLQPWYVEDARFASHTAKVLDISQVDSLTVVDTTTGQTQWTLPLPPETVPIRSAFSPNNRLLAVGVFETNGSDKSHVLIWDMTTGRLLHDVETLFGTNFIQELVFSPDSTAVLSGHESTVNSRTWLYLWDVEDGTEIAGWSLEREGSPVLIYDKSGQLAINSGRFTNINIWNLGTGELQNQFQGHGAEILALALSPDGKTLISGSDDQTLILWDLETGEILHQFTEHNSAVRAVAFSPDGQLVVSGGMNGDVLLWNLETREVIYNFVGHTDAVVRVQFSPDGQRLFTSSLDGTTRQWQLPPYRTTSEILAWVHNNRYIREFTCAERSYYNIRPLCDPAGVAVIETRTPYPTLTPSATPTATLTPNLTQTTATPTLLPSYTPSLTPTIPTNTPQSTNTPVSSQVIQMGTIVANSTVYGSITGNNRERSFDINQWTYDGIQGTVINIRFTQHGMKLKLISPSGQILIAENTDELNTSIELPENGTYIIEVTGNIRAGVYRLLITES